MDGAFAVALGAGMVAAINPCGFALLPAYLSLLVVGDDSSSRTAAVSRALGLTAAMTVSFVAVFGLFGLLVSPLVSSVQQHLPWVTVVMGVLLVAVGGWLLAGRSVRGLPMLGQRGAAPVRLTVPSALAFGMSYALASLSCTIAPFLAVVVSTFRAESVWTGAVLFVTYGVGMGLVVGTAAFAVAMARSSLVRRLRRAGAWLTQATGAFLLLVGAYVVYYGIWEIRVLSGASAGPDPVIGAAESVQRRLVNLVDDVGWLGVGGVLLLLVVTLLVWRVRGRDTERSSSPEARV